MTKVLIADAIKPSLVMSSEIFKDKILGATVVVVGTGEAALQAVVTEKPDICLVDFDLPDVDGPALVVAMRKVYDGPILMTAYPDQNVAQAVLDDLFMYNDASAWIKKPVRFDELSAQIDKFLIEKRRTGRRFTTNIPMKLIGKGEGRGKRAPKADGMLLNLSMGGACVQVDKTAKMKKNQEITLTLSLPVSRTSTTKPKKGAKASAGPETKIKAKVAWVTKTGEMGLQFGKLSDVQASEIETYLKGEMKSVVAA